MQKPTKITKLIILILVITLSLSFVITSAGATDSFLNHYFNKNATIVLVPYYDFNTQWISDFNESLYQWNAAASSKFGTSLTLLRRDPTNRHYEAHFGNNSDEDGKNRIYFDSISVLDDVAGMASTDTVYTGVYLNNISIPTNVNVVVECDIVLNSDCSFVNGTPLSNQYNVWTVFLHEAGHLLGLAHPSTPLIDSVMNTPPIGALKKWVTNSDKNALQTCVVPLA